MGAQDSRACLWNEVENNNYCCNNKTWFDKKKGWCEINDILGERAQGLNWLANGKDIAAGLKLAHLLVIRYPSILSPSKLPRLLCLLDARLSDSQVPCQLPQAETSCQHLRVYYFGRPIVPILSAALCLLAWIEI